MTMPATRNSGRRRLVEKLLRSREPSIRWRVLVEVLGESREEPAIARLEATIRRSPRVRSLMSHVEAAYHPGTNRSVYYKWQGIHWLLASLADLGYPWGDPAVRPLIDRALDVWLRSSYFRTFTARRATPHVGVLVVRGRARRCASQQGNALRYLTVLEGPVRRAAQLAQLLEAWQWPDGGWNCDVTPEADTSSFMETLLPMRGLAAYGAASGIRSATDAARAAAEVFLQRHLFRRRTDRAIIRRDFLRLHYPLYWHYDVLGGLKGMRDVGRLADPRCSEALDWLEGRELPSGGWPADGRYYRVSRTFRSQSEFVSWGRSDGQALNEWVTADALSVLSAAGRFSP